jgi:hypothetical protein
LEDEKSKATENFEFDLKWTANSMYSASGDTVRSSSLISAPVFTPTNLVQTITTVAHFIMAMLSHPEVLMKAQKEIDSVVGTDRLPTMADRASLPYGK